MYIYIYHFYIISNNGTRSALRNPHTFLGCNHFNHNRFYPFRLHEQTTIVQIPNTVQPDNLLRLSRAPDHHPVRGDETRQPAPPDRGDRGTYTYKPQ